jgi:hypothetical protein
VAVDDDHVEGPRGLSLQLEGGAEGKRKAHKTGDHGSVRASIHSGFSIAAILVRIAGFLANILCE